MTHPVYMCVCGGGYELNTIKNLTKVWICNRRFILTQGFSNLNITFYLFSQDFSYLYLKEVVDSFSWANIGCDRNSSHILNSHLCGVSEIKQVAVVALSC